MKKITIFIPDDSVHGIRVGQNEIAFFTKEGDVVALEIKTLQRALVCIRAAEEKKEQDDHGSTNHDPENG